MCVLCERDSITMKFSAYSTKLCIHNACLEASDVTPKLRIFYHGFSLIIASRTEYLLVQMNQKNIGIVMLYNPLRSNPVLNQSHEQLLIELFEFNLDQVYIARDLNIAPTATLASVE